MRTQIEGQTRRTRTNEARCLCVEMDGNERDHERERSYIYDQTLFNVRTSAVDDFPPLFALLRKLHGEDTTEAHRSLAKEGFLHGNHGEDRMENTQVFRDQACIATSSLLRRQRARLDLNTYAKRSTTESHARSFLPLNGGEGSSFVSPSKVARMAPRSIGPHACVVVITPTLRTSFVRFRFHLSPSQVGAMQGSETLHHDVWFGFYSSMGRKDNVVEAHAQSPPFHSTPSNTRIAHEGFKGTSVRFARGSSTIVGQVARHGVDVRTPVECNVHS